MNEREVGNVAAALFQLEAARRNPVNETKKEMFGAALARPERRVEFGGNHPALGGGLEIARLRGEKVEGKEVKAQLQALDGKAGGLNAAELKQARMPYIGAVAGEDVPRAQFVRGQDRGLNRQQLIAKYGAVNGEVAARLNERAGQMTGNQPDGFGMAKGPAPLQRNEDQLVNGVRIDNDMKNTLAELNSGAYQGNPTRPLDAGLRAELSSLSGGRVDSYDRPAGPVMADRKKSIGEIMKREGNRAKSFVTSPRYKGARRGAALYGGAAAAGLTAGNLVKGERDRREEEQYS
jgi:hypothetical protein